VIDLDLDEPEDFVQEPSPETGVERERLVEVIETTNRMPEGHVTHPNLLRQLRRREEMVTGERGLDWGCAEALAYGSLLMEGRSIRLAGQDSGRGTFSHRHAVIRDQRTGAEHVPLRQLAADDARFEAWDSLLSEEAALAFEYGYSLGRPHALTIWEAQFGDFANGAQIPIDQFVVAGQAKWKQKSGVTLLLPHGYDGQGPEHSSARLERFLTLCSDGNIQVCNCTTPAQFFHLMRRQARAEQRHPLVVMTPKSLLRDPRAQSPVDDLTAGRFHELLEDPEVRPEDARRLILCSGKVYYDLVDRRREEELTDVSIARVEQLYPLPRPGILALLERLAGDDVVWCQEEPRNMGAWPFMLQRFLDMERRLRYVGRAESASPATGSYKRHVAEQEHLVQAALVKD
jgi:2-oxoglutarate dehydrogenase E1 component